MSQLSTGNLKNLNGFISFYFYMYCISLMPEVKKEPLGVILSIIVVCYFPVHSLPYCCIVVMMC